MITYKNISNSAKTFYGVKFMPGDAKAVPGYVNSNGMIRFYGVNQIPTNKEPIYDTPKRGRKKAAESEKDSKAEITETQIMTEEETSNGNPS